MHEVRLELAEDGETVRFAASKHDLGKVSEDHVKQVILAMPYDALSGGLTNRIYRWVPDYLSCPQCGGTRFFEQQRITDSVSYGFCEDCQLTIHKVNGRWVSYPQLNPYLRRHNMLTGEVTP